MSNTSGEMGWMDETNLRVSIIFRCLGCEQLHHKTPSCAYDCPDRSTPLLVRGPHDKSRVKKTQTIQSAANVL